MASTRPPTVAIIPRLQQLYYKAHLSMLYQSKVVLTAYALLTLYEVSAFISGERSDRIYPSLPYFTSQRPSAHTLWRNIQQENGLVAASEQQDYTETNRQLRFGGVARLYSSNDASPNIILDRLHNATVAVIGLGGVGSWAAEAICRSGVGNMILVDLDDICISNTNRQLHAVDGNIGQLKTEAMQKRLQSINPDCNIQTIHDFVTRDNTDELFNKHLRHVNVILDAIDASPEKAAMVVACVKHNVPIVTCGGSAGKQDPTQVVCNDLVFADGDRLLGNCKRTLRRHHNFARGLRYHDMKKNRDKIKLWGINAVYSLEVPKTLSPQDDDAASSFRLCDGALGTACFVTGTFGFVAAARVVDMIALDSYVTPNDGHRAEGQVGQ